MDELKVLDKNDIEMIRDFMDSIKFNLIANENINLDYYLFPEKSQTELVNVEVSNTHLYESKLVTLFPNPYYNFNTNYFTKTNNHYNINQIFNLGSVCNNNNVLEEITNEVLEGEEWKFNTDDYIDLIDFEKIKDLSKKLTQELSKEYFKEIDERTIRYFNRQNFYEYHPPLLIHRFGITGMPFFYTGSQIYLKTENLRLNEIKQSTLFENIIKFHKFLKV